MSLRSLRRVAALGCIAASVAACSDMPTEPARPTAGVHPGVSAPSLEVVVPPVQATGLTRRTPLPQNVTVTKTIDAHGGTIRIREAGLRVFVPPGAVSHPVQFTATALAGSLVAYDFGPHGMRFQKPLRVEQELQKLDWGPARTRAHGAWNLEAGYFKDRLQLDQSRGTALVDEFLPMWVDYDVHGQHLAFAVAHFSGYMVSCGRGSTAH
jgi:hypothetical protein